MKTQLLRAGSILLDERMAVSLDLPTMVWFVRITNPTNPPFISLFPPRLYVSSWLDSHLPCFSRTFIYPKAAPSTHHSLLHLNHAAGQSWRKVLNLPRICPEQREREPEPQLQSETWNSPRCSLLGPPLRWTWDSWLWYKKEFQNKLVGNKVRAY